MAKIKDVKPGGVEGFEEEFPASEAMARNEKTPEPEAALKLLDTDSDAEKDRKILYMPLFHHFANWFQKSSIGLR